MEWKNIFIDIVNNGIRRIYFTVYCMVSDK